ncbi:hypothetical protein EVAR_61803_1 [Eumeta japonica]|uniref:Uncharacterized protein n=1 Tax=Eumeta variegata TaxID=151549 RepID=A0A4C1YXU2_EUMVA|nr:hypothetical protein EVAR_61803_1 [Eumeta japonica]
MSRARAEAPPPPPAPARPPRLPPFAHLRKFRLKHFECEARAASDRPPPAPASRRSLFVRRRYRISAATPTALNVTGAARRM